MFSVYQNVVFKSHLLRDKTPFWVKYYGKELTRQHTVWRPDNLELMTNSETSAKRTKINTTSLPLFVYQQRAVIRGKKETRKKKFHQFSVAWFSYQTEVIVIIPLPQSTSRMIKKRNRDLSKIYAWDLHLKMSWLFLNWFQALNLFLP